MFVFIDTAKLFVELPPSTVSGVVGFMVPIPTLPLSAIYIVEVASAVPAELPLKILPCGREREDAGTLETVSAPLET